MWLKPEKWVKKSRPRLLSTHCIVPNTAKSNYAFFHVRVLTSKQRHLIRVGLTGLLRRCKPGLIMRLVKSWRLRDR
jgi:hypothetical protein